MAGLLLFKIIGTVCHAVSEAKKPYLTEEESCHKMGIQTVDEMIEEIDSRDTEKAQREIDSCIEVYNESKEKFLEAAENGIYFSACFANTSMNTAKNKIQSTVRELRRKNKTAAKRIKVDVEYLDDDFIEEKIKELREKMYAQARENDKKKQ